jgi:hypothetical protein
MESRYAMRKILRRLQSMEHGAVDVRRQWTRCPANQECHMDAAYRVDVIKTSFFSNLKKENFYQRTPRGIGSTERSIDLLSALFNR